MGRLFGTSGIRAVANVELTPELALKVGMAIATYTNGGDVLVAHDTRTSSPMLESAVTAGLLSGGSTVHRLGLAPTPALAYLTRELGMDAGVMLTASHNPPEYNGIKVFNSDGVALSPEEQSRIEEIISSESYQRRDWRGVGHAVDASGEIERYVNAILSAVDLKREWRVVLDPGCGATSALAPELFRRAGCRVYSVNSQPDGFFPGRSPNPTEDAVRLACSMVRDLGADVGFAYDGDGDRVVVIDEEGRYAPLDQSLAAYAAHVVRLHGGGVVATNVEASMCVDEAVEAAGGRVVRARVGDVHVAQAVKEHGAVFGGEPCGAWIHPKHHLAPDGVLSSLLFLAALETEGAKPSDFLSGVPVYPVVRVNVPCENSEKPRVMSAVDGRIEGALQPVDILRVDGVAAKLSDGWVLVRPSGTEPLIRITAEAKTEERARELADFVVKLVEEAKAG